MSLAFLDMLLPGCCSTGFFMTKGSLGLFNLNFLAKGMSSSSSQVSITLLLILIVASVSTSLTSEVEGFDSEGSEVDGFEIEGFGTEGLDTKGLETEGLIVASVSTSLTSLFLFEEPLERRRLRSNVLETECSEVEGLDSEGSEVEGLDSEGSEFEGLEIEEARDGGSLFSGDFFTIGFDGFR